jgi:hypothetical protein
MRISREVRGLALHKRSDKSLTKLAEMYNPCIRGWITHYSHFYKTQLRSTLKRATPMSSGGHAASSSGCAIRPRVHEIGSTGSAERIQISWHTGRYAMAMAEQWESYESRGSRTVLREPGGESPPGHSSRFAGFQRVGLSPLSPNVGITQGLN